MATRGAELRIQLCGALVTERGETRVGERRFLPGEDGPWIEGRRRALHETLVQATEFAAEAELRRGEYAGAERIARAAVVLDPLRESGYRLLMRALAAAGNGAQAVRIMDECRAALRDEAGAAPSAATERAFREAVGLARQNR